MESNNPWIKCFFTPLSMQMMRAFPDFSPRRAFLPILSSYTMYKDLLFKLRGWTTTAKTKKVGRP